MAVLWGGLPDHMVQTIARTVNGRDAIHWCAVNKEFHRMQPKLEVLVLGGYTHKGESPYGHIRVPVEDAAEGLTVRMLDGLRGLRIIEQIGARYGAELKKLYVALPGEATRADLWPRPLFGATLIDLRELHLLHRTPGAYTDDDEWDHESEDNNDPGIEDGGGRVESVSHLITSVAKTLQVLYLDCGTFMDSANVTPLFKLLRPDMKRLVVDLTPFRWRSNQSSP
jgi:hypothetical protein